MKKIGLLLLVCLLTTIAIAQSKLSVVEVSTTIYDKPLRGFRFLIPLPEAIFREAIHQHFASHHLRPLDMEQVVLFDYVMYAEVSLELPLTLFFVLTPLSDNSTQVTVCAQYTAQQCITVADAPDLAMRLLMEVSKITESTRYGILDIGPLFQNTLPQDIRARYEDRRERLDQQLYLSSGPILQSDDNQLAEIGRSPFASPQNAPQFPAGDSDLAEVLADRFGQYIGQPASPHTDPRPALAMQALRDSFDLVLRNERNQTLRQAAELQALEARLACFDPESQQAQLQLKAYKQRIMELSKLEADLQARETYVKMQEKLHEQRLRYLADYEQNKDNAALLKRIRELEAALQRLEFAQFEAMRN